MEHNDGHLLADEKNNYHQNKCYQLDSIIIKLSKFLFCENKDATFQLNSRFIFIKWDNKWYMYVLITKFILNCHNNCENFLDGV